MKRFSVFDRYDAPLFDLSDEVTGALRSEEINKEHKLDITTTQPLEEGMRILFRDGMLELHEFVIDDPDSHHDGASVVEGTYGCTWSMQYDLAGKDGGVLWASAEPGTLDPITARRALEIALSPQSRWEVGNVTLQAMGGASLHDGQVWDYLAKLVNVFGGEIEPRIEVDSDGTIHRYVDWSARIGSEDAVRRFDYGEDCTFIRRKEAPGPRYCGIRPRGGSERTDDDGVDYSDRCGVEEEPEYDRDGIWHPANSPYVYDRAAMDDFKRPDGQGGWEYPCLTVIYDLETDGDQEELLNKAIPDVRGYVYPDTTYEANVLQFVNAGMDAHGVRLGDTVHIVDRRFGDSPLRLEARVTKMETNELDDSDVTLTIGSFGKVEDAIRDIAKSEVGPMDERLATIENGGTIAYVETLLDAINAELNVTGGYYYLVPGRGIYTYDRAVSDPTVGTEATAVTQIVGGGIRIANSRTAQGDWDWKSVFVSGHVLAELVTAAQLVAGYIGNASRGSYWDLDNNVLTIGMGDTIGGRTVQGLLNDVDSYAISMIEYGISESSTTSPESWSTTAPTNVSKGSWLWVRTTYRSGGTSTTKTYVGTDGTNGADGADGADGQDGADGIGITSVTPQYYLSTSISSATGGSWSSDPPTWQANHYIWTRSLITWNTTPETTSTTTEVYDAALTQANQQAVDSAKVATDYIADGSSGTDFGKTGVSSKVRITDIGMEVFDGNGDSALFAGLQGGNSVVRVGRASNSGNVVMSSEGSVDIRNSSTVMAHFGYGEGTDSSGGTSEAPYYDIGIRNASGAIGNYSVAEGRDSTASGFISHAEGEKTTASGAWCHAEGLRTTANYTCSHAEGWYSTASGQESHAEGLHSTASGMCSHAEGLYATASGDYSHAEGCYTTASGDYQHVQGKYNISSSSYAHIVGWGNRDSQKNIEYLTGSGNLWIAGTLTQNSDRRLKEHHAYLGEDACDFIRALKPALYTKDGTRHVGFYAQDVQDAEPDGWDTETVTAQHTDESLDFDPLTLDYNALIAPLVAYAQQLERRIDQQQKAIDQLIERVNTLEGRPRP